jgi:hypothetical protein
MLLKCWLQLLAQWRPLFTQERTFQRALTLAAGLLGALGRRTVTAALSFLGKTQQDWTADYRFFSQAKWDTAPLFDPVLDQAVRQYLPAPWPVTVGFDDTSLPRTGKKIRTAGWQRDPMSPPFHPNLRWGQRFLQASLLLPLYQQNPTSAARALPVRFVECPVVRKPGKRAKVKVWRAYKRAKKTHNLSVRWVQEVTRLRQRLDQLGYAERPLLAVGDGSFCNRTTFRAKLERTSRLCRAKKNLRLCFRHTGPGRRFYGEATFTPLEVYQDKQRPWQEIKIFYGGKRRTVRCKVVTEVLWRGGAGRQLLRLMVIAPIPYRLTKHGYVNFRQPAFLLADDLTTPVPTLVQSYFDRVQMEYNHRDEKSILGVGHAQVWSPKSLPRLPEFMVAAYSALLLAGLTAYGVKRTAAYLPLPKWRVKPVSRPSCQDLVSLLRQQMAEATEVVIQVPWPSYEQMVLKAAA